MLFRCLPVDEFRVLVELLMRETEVVGPKRVATRPDGTAVHHYLPVAGFDELDLAY